MHGTVTSVIAIALSLVVVSGQQDQTVQPGATGAGVVEAVCSRIEVECIFPEDKLFTRRLAYVESSDGNSPDTFRPGYYGGIWQVDRAMFDVTQTSPASNYLRQPMADIQTAFGINWASVKWEDLLMPLHSALAARLYLQYHSNNISIPRSIDDQAVYWTTYYRPASPASDYSTAANQLEESCSNGNGADIIFVLDASGSIGSSNFVTMKSFVKDVVNSFDVGTGAEHYRFGVITYSNSAKREFDLITYSTKSEILAAVDRIIYTGGGTSTHLGIDEMTLRGFTTVNGARPIEQGHPRVGIVVTDGQSGNPSATAAAATRAHDADITVIAVGVGSGVNVNELKTIASEPVCMNVIRLDFEEFESLKHIIEKRACDAPITIAPGQNSTTGGQLPAGGDQNCKVKVSAEGATIQLETSEGLVSFYISKMTYPSEDFYEKKVVAEPDRMGVMFIPHSSTNNGTIFCNIKGDNYTETNITVGAKPGDVDNCANRTTCLNGGECINTPDSYRCECPPQFIGEKCETPVTTPTTTRATTTTMKPINSGETYNCDSNNPCTQENIDNNKLYFPHDDANKFVQCDTWGKCYVKDCPPGLVWDVAANTCNWP